MEENITNKRYLRLVDAVRKMRNWQKAYLKYHSSYELKKMKYYQWVVDRLIKEEVARQKSGQKELF